MHHLVRITFGAIFCTTIAFLLYLSLFGWEGHHGGIYLACQASERPISMYYDRYGRQPAELWDKKNAGNIINSGEEVETLNQADLLGHPAYSEAY